jgi:hypothetical protein
VADEPKDASPPRGCAFMCHRMIGSRAAPVKLGQPEIGSSCRFPVRSADRTLAPSHPIDVQWTCEDASTTRQSKGEWRTNRVLDRSLVS